MFSKLYLRGATGCIIVSDITRTETLKSAIGWKELVNKCFEEEGQPTIPIILFQNKVDLLDVNEKDSSIKADVLREFDADNNFIGNIETSAKENNNIKEGISHLVDEIIKKRGGVNVDNEDDDNGWSAGTKTRTFIIAHKSKNGGAGINIKNLDRREDGTCFKC